MLSKENIRTGMDVWSADGKKLGKVVETGDTEFIVEKGFFFPKDYRCAYSDVQDIKGDDLHLCITSDNLSTAASAGSAAGAAPSSKLASDKLASDKMAADKMAADKLASDKMAAEKTPGMTEEYRVPLAEEELTAEKRVREAGEVTIRKEVKVEEKQVSVPVTREEVKVERVPATGHPAGGATFKEGTVSVPVHEEEVEIKKRPVVREEVVVTKERYPEERRAAETVRKETADVKEPKE